MLKPKYNGGNIVNLISSIQSNFGIKDIRHELLKIMPNEFEGSKNVILMVIDGLGYNFFVKNSKLLKKYLVGQIDTVFPTTTTAALSTFNTGLTPYEHSLISRFMNIKELGTSGVVLSNTNKMFSKITTKNKRFSNNFDIYGVNTVYQKISVNSYIIQRNEFKNTNYTKFISKGTKKNIGYLDLDDGLIKLNKVLLKNEPKYIYFYFDLFDNTLHKNGCDSIISKKYFNKLEEKLFNFLENISLPGTSLIITGDHGHMVNTLEERINLNIFKDLNKLLSIRPEGDSRVLCLFIRLGKKKEFLEYYEKNMKKYFIKYSYQQIIKNGLFGKGKEGEKFYDRVGDYVLIARNNYTVGNFLDNETEKYHTGNHSGLSSDELYIPLIFYKKTGF